MIRIEEKNDWAAVYALNSSVFATSAEANLVDVLREEAGPIISLVAEENNKIVGHIMFSPVSLSSNSEVNIMGLAPMAVDHKFQRRGVGSALVRAGLEQCKEIDFNAVVVLGHPEYYPRFGFKPSSHFGIECEYDVPEDVFMVMELQPGYLHGMTGIIKYHAAFGNV